eukprot:11078533-Alexandrium_andersonii.AAC.1
MAARARATSRPRACDGCPPKYRRQRAAKLPAREAANSAQLHGLERSVDRLSIERRGRVTAAQHRIGLRFMRAAVQNSSRKQT